MNQAPTVSSRSHYRWRRLRAYALLALGDLVAILIAFALASLIRFGEIDNRFGVKAFAVFAPAYLVIAALTRAYGQEVLTRPRLGTIRAIQSAIIASFAFFAILFALKASEDFSRLVFAIGVGLSLFALPPMRMILGRRIGRESDWIFRRDLLLVDEVDVSGKFPDRLDAAAEGLRPDRDDPAMLDRLSSAVQHADRIIIASPPDRRRAWAAALRGAAVDVELLAPELGELGAMRMKSVEDIPTLLVATGPLSLRDRMLKRLFDLAVALPATIILAPLLLLVAIAIKLDSKGPIFFRQPRMGSRNRMFDILKFRSMRVDSEDVAGARSTSQDDPRFTRVGRFIRRTSIDELPQLLNVLSGQMSIVGPRPHALGSKAEDKHFWEIDKRYWDRHAIKPGMTGLAQVRGHRGATDATDDLDRRLQSDLEYISNWSLWQDLIILLRTVGVLTHRKAY